MIYSKNRNSTGLLLIDWWDVLMMNNLSQGQTKAKKVKIKDKEESWELLESPACKDFLNHIQQLWNNEYIIYQPLSILQKIY